MLQLDGITELSTEYTLQLVRKYGEDSLAYLTLEQGKEYFFGNQYEGFIAYVLVKGTVVCLGNPVCARENLENLINEFKEFCQQRKWKICFCSVSTEMTEILAKNGYVIAKYGEEAILDLNTYTTAGSSAAKLRQKLRRAEKSGIKTVEYQPQKWRDHSLEEKIIRVSEEWYADKNGKLTFTLGELNLDNPLERRYFLAVDEKEEVQAVLMFSPFRQGKGYFLDVMRRRKESVPGVMEKAIIDAAMKMKEEGVSYLSLGLAPLAGIAKQSRMNLLEKCLNFTYNHLNHDYGFKTLYDYKKKFSPSRWEIRYVVHQPDLSFFQVGYAMIRSRNANNSWYQFILGIGKVGKILLKHVCSKCTDLINAKLNYQR